MAKIFGRGEMARQFVAPTLRARTQTMGLRVELMERATDVQFNQPATPEIALSPRVGAGGRIIEETCASGPEFLPPKVHTLEQQILDPRVQSSRRKNWSGRAARQGAVVACVAGSVSCSRNGRKISRLESKMERDETEGGRIDGG